MALWPTARIGWTLELTKNGGGLLHRTIRALWQLVVAGASRDLARGWAWVFESVMAFFWALMSVLPVYALYDGRVSGSIQGWRLGETLVVLAVFLGIQSIADAAIGASAHAHIEAIRKRKFDSRLLLPIDPQLLLLASGFRPTRLLGMIPGGAVLVLGFRELGRGPTLEDCAAGALLSIVGAGCLCMLWMIALSLAFFARVSNLVSLLAAILGAARWPVDSYRGMLQILFLAVIPLRPMTSIPALAFLGGCRFSDLVLSFVWLVVLGTAARMSWGVGVRRYLTKGE